MIEGKIIIEEEEKKVIKVFDGKKMAVAPEFPNWIAIGCNALIKNKDRYCRPFDKNNQMTTPERGVSLNTGHEGRPFTDFSGDKYYCVYRRVTGPRILSGNPIYSERLPLP